MTLDYVFVYHYSVWHCLQYLDNLHGAPLVPVVEETESGVIGTPFHLWLCMHRPVTAAMCCVQVCCAVVEAAVG
jgi:hypothetical protein